MTLLSTNPALEESLPTTTTDPDRLNTERDNDLCLNLPAWVEQLRDDWGEPLGVPEWDDVDSYRQKNGWQGRDLVHDHHAPVRVLEYFVQYGSGIITDNNTCISSKGGVDTTLTGICHFTPRAESHKGFCHGGSMTGLMDDVIGWCAFLTTGTCRPWTGFTVQVNTSLKKPIRVDSFLLVKAKITKVERRKVSVTAELIDPANNNSAVHALGEGLVVLNKGVLPEQQQQPATHKA
ncbi:Thioesterase superfamily [Seminavis robusta]|uniref:Acyl-coenzyme A thioesterase THEM4 n=1 Tax=Seminavis robusta TaxID=568900 RepID=A0A9N8DZA2_9STRA|nr:Thioesterase superfamily [Seminavis robusta]|eukprot:Sro408_g137070.1 Thioesterase superfamily (235) ;mRNA; f:64934-65638